MSYIALMFSATELFELTYNPALTDSEQRLYDTITPKATLVNRTVDEGVLLSGRRYSHLIHKHFEWDITISADELNTSDVEFIENFLDSPFKYISTHNGTSWSNYIQVISNSGRTPIDYIEGLEDLPEITLNLRKVLSE